MGDRANIRVLQSHGQTGDTPQAVYLYTHWRGTDLVHVLQRALLRKQRWDDEAYLARIIFCEMVKGDEDGEAGFGIATSPPDNGHQILTVDCEKQRVRIGPQDKAPTHNISFKQFIEMSPGDLNTIYLEREEDE